eukprot:527791-Pelagomonas_calceolata.AAC.12
MAQVHAYQLIIKEMHSVLLNQTCACLKHKYFSSFRGFFQLVRGFLVRHAEGQGSAHGCCTWMPCLNPASLGHRTKKLCGMRKSVRCYMEASTNRHDLDLHCHFIRACHTVWAPKTILISPKYIPPKHHFQQPSCR